MASGQAGPSSAPYSSKVDDPPPYSLSDPLAATSPSKPQPKRKRSSDSDSISKPAPQTRKKHAREPDGAKPGDTLVFREPQDVKPPPSLTLHTATGILSEYAGSLRNNLAVHGLEWAVKEHNGICERQGFSSTVSLPFNSPVRFAEGDRQKSKKLAKAAASLSAVHQLMRYGEIGPDLTLRPMHPGHRKRKEAKAVADPGRRNRPYIAGPKWWANSPPLDAASLFGSVIKLELEGFPDKAAECRPLLLVTSRPLPFDGGHFDVSGNKVPAFAQLSASFPLKIRPKDLDRAIVYSTVLFEGVCHRHVEFQPDIARYLILPLKWAASITSNHPLTRDHITWGEVVDTWKHPLQPLRYREYDALKAQCEGRVVCGTPTTLRWVVHGVRDDLRPDSIREGDVLFGTLSKGERKSYGYAAHSVVTDSTQPLLDVEAEIDNIVTGVVSNLEVESNRKELVLPELLSVHSISAGTFRTASILPAFIPMLDTQLLGMEMSETLFGGRIKPHLAREAITPSQARPVLCLQDYQRLELLGDSVLRMAVVCLLYVHLAQLNRAGDLPNEGALVTAGNFIQQNTTLTASAEKANVAGYIRGVYRSPAEWLPHGWSPTPKAPMLQDVGKKVMADVTEALIGATLLSAQDNVLQFLSSREGLELVLATMRDLTIPAPSLKWADLRGLQLPTEVLGQVSSQSLTVLGYTFKDPAKGHIALSTTKGRIHFERYEHIGDALLGLMAMLHLWDEYPRESNAALTNAKQSRVSNGSLAAFLVSSRIVDLLTDDNAATAMETAKVAAGLRAAQAKTDALGPDEQRSAYWNTVPTNKRLGDHVEALFGAILDDSNFDPQPAMKVYDTYVAPFMRKYALPPTEGGMHPHTQLQHMLGKRNCYSVWKEQQNVYDDNNKAVKCIITVKIHDEVVGMAEAQTRPVAERLAFAAAVDHVRNNPNNPLCHCKRK